MRIFAGENKKWKDLSSLQGENKKWKDLSSLQPRKKMLKHIYLFQHSYSVRTRIITITNFLI